jgi:hypothetical protein
MPLDRAEVRDWTWRNWGGSSWYARRSRRRHVYSWMLLSSLRWVVSERDALRNEYKIYHLLRKSGVTTGITTPLGLFDDVEGGHVRS